MGGKLSVDSGSRNYSIINNKDEKGRVLTYSVYSHITQNFRGEFNSLREARSFVRLIEDTRRWKSTL